MISEKESSNKEALSNYLDQISLDCSKPVVLLDADRTLCREDTGKNAFRKLNLDLVQIKNGFKEHGYKYQGFKTMSDILSSSDKDQYLSYCKQVAFEVELYSGVVSFLVSSSKIFNIIIVTAGCGPIWENIMLKNNLSIKVISGGHSKCDNFLIGRGEKGFIAKYFKKTTKKTIISIGDSDVDTLMLKASDKKGIVVNHRKNKDLLSNFYKHQIDFQMSFNEYNHSEIPQITFNELEKTITGE